MNLATHQKGHPFGLSGIYPWYAGVAQPLQSNKYDTSHRQGEEQKAYVYLNRCRESIDKI